MIFLIFLLEALIIGVSTIYVFVLSHSFERETSVSMMHQF